MKDISKHIEDLVRKASFSLRKDIEKALEKAYHQEKEKKAKMALGWILENAKIAEKEKIALCQDTGLPVIFIEAGNDVKLTAALLKRVRDAVLGAYKDNCLRPSLVDPLTRNNPQYQGLIEHIIFLPKAKGLRITILPKGFGSENKTQLKMFEPTAQIKQIEEFIVNCVKEAGPESCPPFFLGIGIGGTSEYALYLAKKALLDKIDSPNNDKFLRTLEKRILSKINSLKIGPMGLGGKFTALAVKIKKSQTHIAGLPVGVNISCHALRSATIKIK